jgi:hypothetical protein
MKYLFLAIVLYILAQSAWADIGNAYLLKIEITHDKGVVKGYIRIGGYLEIDSVSAARFYASDSLFTSFVKENAYGDTLQIYRQVYTIDSLYVNVFFKDTRTDITKSKIIRIKLKKIQDGFIWAWATPERYSVKDVLWLKKPYLYKEEYYTEGCVHTLYFFEKPKTVHPFDKVKTKSPRKAPWDMDAQNTEQWDKLLDDYFKFIEKEKVLVKSECGC